MRKFKIFPLWGAAEAYPPENADLAVLWGKSRANITIQGLILLAKLLPVTAFLIANRESLENKDLSQILMCFDSQLTAKPRTSIEHELDTFEELKISHPSWSAKEINLALPDGHQQLPTLRLLNKAGIQVDDYPSPAGNRRPTTNLPKVMIKVIRPQDMPLQVANGNFDLAITGQDWLREHLYQFPSSPATELLNLKFGWVRIVAVVSNSLSVNDIDGLRQFNANRSVPLRVASEYVNIADKYARDNHLGMYRIIPTWGASEAFLPEDADLLVENAQTGRTIARHNLKIVDTLFESTACLISNTSSITSPATRQRMKSIVGALQQAVEEN